MSTKAKNALTMMEILIVIAIVAMLAGGMLFVSNKAKSQADKQLVADTIALLDTALQQYYDYTRTYPLECQNTVQLQTATGGTVVNIAPDGTQVGNWHDDKFSSIEGMYFYLTKVPQSKQVIDKIATSLAIADVSGNATAKMAIRFPTDIKPLMRVIDPWKHPLEYQSRSGNFPLIKCYGPDGDPNTSDDIENRKN
jgi:prepilin-type N-terminal cleavage/methylation domain-containing protein